MKDGYLYSSLVGGEIGTNHIGSFRVKVEFAVCREVSLLAQQIYNPRAQVTTFRKWNPRKLDSKFTQSKDA